MSSLYRDKNNFAEPTAAHDFSPELGIGYPASGWWAILKLFPLSRLRGNDSVGSPTCPATGPAHALGQQRRPL
jgi:hypothetical protein